MKKDTQIFKAMSFFVVCLICNACSWLAEDPGVDVNWQNIQIMNKSGEKIYALEFMFKDSTLLNPQYVFEVFGGKLLIETENDSSFIGKIPIPVKQDQWKISVESSNGKRTWRYFTKEQVDKNEVRKKVESIPFEER